MSVRYEYSYWLTAKPVTGNPDPEDFIKAMKNQELLHPEGSLVAEIQSDRSITAEVNPKVGTVEEDQCIFDSLDKVAAACPEYEITLKANNEEDHSESSLTTWADGKNNGTAYARTIEPGEYDDVTVNVTLERVCALLRKHGAEWLIPITQKEFEERGWLHGR